MKYFTGAFLISVFTTTNGSLGWRRTASWLHLYPHWRHRGREARGCCVVHPCYCRNAWGSWWTWCAQSGFCCSRLCCHEGLPLELWARINSTSLDFSHQSILSHWQEEKPDSVLYIHKRYLCLVPLINFWEILFSQKFHRSFSRFFPPSLS